MKLKELIGKTITNIYGVAEYNTGGVDTVECFVEIDNATFIEVPSYSNAQEVVEKNLLNNAVCIIPQHTDEMVCDPDPEDNQIVEQRTGLLTILFSFFRKQSKPSGESNSIVTEFLPLKDFALHGKPKYIKNRKIVDFLWYPDTPYHSGFLLLENGCVVGETLACLHGIGRAGLNYYRDLASLEDHKGDGYKRLSEYKEPVLTPMNA